jgi:hypothetical protein
MHTSGLLRLCKQLWLAVLRMAMAWGINTCQAAVLVCVRCGWHSGGSPSDFACVHVLFAACVSN